VNSRFVWMDGRLVPFEQATVPFLSPALHYGLAVFEGVRAYATPRGPGIFRLREHAERLVHSARIFGLRDFGVSAADLGLAMAQTVAANGFASCYIRPVIYMASGGWNLNLDTARPAVGIAAWEWTQFLGAEAMERGVRANVSSFTRHHPNVTMTKAKISGNYANSVLAKTESVRLGFDEAIMLDPYGFVAECTGENLFLVRDRKIRTPDSATVLEGITRDALVTIARDRGYEVVEGPVSRDQLYAADEVFVCGTAAEVVALREIDFRTIGAGRTGPVTREMQQAFHAAARGEDPRYADWITVVTPECLPEGWAESGVAGRTSAVSAN
jgi:branched-chain amino acid aminotransferase